VAQIEPWAFTRRDAARLLGLSVRTIDKLIKRGELSAIRVTAKAVRIPADSIRNFIDRRRCLRPGE
jgi:excisionase family DNA binding protein